MSSPTGPLEGIRVLDLGQIYAGGYAGFLLATAGADVIKVEPPDGENLRRRGKVGGGAYYPFAMLNGNKRSIRVDLKTEAGAEVFRDLVRNSDVVFENFAPGVMDRLGLGYDDLREINPRLVYGSVSGYGRSGPYTSYPAMDLTVQAMVGVMSTTGFPDSPPVKAGPAICDFMAGVHLVSAISMALVARARTGVGQRVEVTMQEATYPTLASSLGLVMTPNRTANMTYRSGNRHGGYSESPYNVYKAADGYVAILCVTDQHWVSLGTLVGGEALATDERYRELKDRAARNDELDVLIAAWALAQDRQTIVDQLLAVRVPCAPVRELPEVVEDPNMWARGMLRTLDHPVHGPITVNHSPLLFGDGERADLNPSPGLGEHTDAVLTDILGYSEQAIADLKGQEVI